MSTSTPSPSPHRRIPVITGPTATGKSLLALRLAEWLGGTVINADSMQVYDALDILTARPGSEPRARVPHRLYGTIAVPQVCSAARWTALADAACSEALAAGHLPILVGGTGLYLRALLEGLAEIPEVPDHVRQEAQRRYDHLGGRAFRATLAESDPITAARLEPGDRQRLVRAWEVWAATGRPLSAWQAATESRSVGPVPLRMDVVHLIVLPDRATLYASCDRRFDTMLAGGALDEVSRLLTLNPPADHPIRKALGVPELSDHLLGRQSLPAAAARAKAATRRYAKRQTTWLRHQVLNRAATAPYRHRLVIPTLITESVCAQLRPAFEARLGPCTGADRPP